ncbi:MAG TPA: hypothetical protein VKS60_20530, partial [Stellaceae bacterium]|nr:hypothetical protein [Stellaceae bacterium]
MTPTVPPVIRAGALRLGARLISYDLRTPTMSDRPSALGDVLSRSGRLPPATLERAGRLAAESGEKLDAVLTRLGLITERELAEFLAEALGMPLAATSDFPSEPVLDGRIAPAFLKTERLMPLVERSDGVVVAMADPTDEENATAVAFAAGRPVSIRVACATDIDAAWERLYGHGESSLAAAAEAAGDGASEDVERLKDLASEAPVIRLVNQI